MQMMMVVQKMIALQHDLGGVSGRLCGRNGHFGSIRYCHVHRAEYRGRLADTKLLIIFACSAHNGDDETGPGAQRNRHHKKEGRERKRKTESDD